MKRFLKSKAEWKTYFTKLKEVGLIILLQYADWHQTPEPDTAFFHKLGGDESVLRRLLIEGIEKDEIMADADRICLGAFRVFDMSPDVFKNGINWHKDYYTDYEWPLKPFNLIYDPNDSGVDLNIPFELSRLQFTPTLIQAFEITSDQKYVIKFCELLNLWIKENPYCLGVNWWSSMDVALRAVNLALGVGFLFKHISEELLKHYLKVLWKHALYLYKYDVVLSKVKNKNNHYLASMLGLLVASMCFKGSKAEVYREHARNEFIKEIPRQFLEDGGNFESATGYHQFSLEVVLTAILFLHVYSTNDTNKSVCENQFGRDIHERLSAALDLVSDYMSCYGESPHIGDSSDCRVIIFRDYFDRRASDHCFLLKLGELSIGYSEKEERSLISKIYPKAGYAFFKNKNYGIVAFAGPKGTNGTGGHGHNDKCSFVLQVGGKQILVDSGTFIYNPAVFKRFELKRGKAHNTVVIDDKEQCEINPELVFGLKGEINPRMELKAENGSVEIKMEHDGYTRFGELGPVLREIVWEEKNIEIQDTLNGTSVHNVSVFFNLHPSVSVDIVKNCFQIVCGSSNIRVVMPNRFRLQLENSFYSRSYHEEMKNIRVVAKANLRLPTSWKTEIELL